MKLSTNQIITFIVAFLIGVGITSYAMRDKGSVEIDSDEVMEEITEETEEVETETNTDEANETLPTTTGNNTAPATTATTSTSTNTGNCSTGLSGYKDTKLNAIVLSWTPCASDNFQFYKLVKSSKNSSPTYPGDPVAFSSSNKNAASFVDKTVAQRTTYYYKICVVQRLGATNCSNVVSVSF